MPPCTRRDVRLLVPPARSPFSNKMVRSPRRAASRVIPAPWIPPPMTTRSYRSKPGSPCPERVCRKLPHAARASQRSQPGLDSEGEAGEHDADERASQDVGREVTPEKHATGCDP